MWSEPVPFQTSDVGESEDRLQDEVTQCEPILTDLLCVPRHSRVGPHRLVTGVFRGTNG